MAPGDAFQLTVNPDIVIEPGCKTNEDTELHNVVTLIVDATPIPPSVTGMIPTV